MVYSVRMRNERSKPIKRPSVRAARRVGSQPSRRGASTTPAVLGGASIQRRGLHPTWVVAGVALIAVVVVLVVFAAGAFSSAPAQAPADNTGGETASSDPTAITLTFAGDCTLGTDESFDRSTSFNARYDSVDDPSWFFSNVAGIFAADDLSIVNMEGTLTESSDRQDKTFAFKGDAEYAQVLVQGDVEAASMANNHSKDYGEQSYADTIATLEGAGISTFGYERIAYFDVKGVKVALIGTYELALGIDVEDEMTANIRAAQEAGARIIAVYAHWGVEREYVPDDVQIELAHSAIDAGAHLVIGSHPHVIQGYEKYKGRYIVYSLGNFCFGGNSDPDDKDCLMFQQTFAVAGDEVADDDAVDIIACSISSTSERNNYQPTPAEGSEKERIEAKVRESNAAIAERSAALQD